MHSCHSIFRLVGFFGLVANWGYCRRPEGIRKDLFASVEPQVKEAAETYFSSFWHGHIAPTSRRGHHVLLFCCFHAVSLTFDLVTRSDMTFTSSEIEKMGVSCL